MFKRVGNFEYEREVYCLMKCSVTFESHLMVVCLILGILGVEMRDFEVRVVTEMVDAYYPLRAYEHVFWFVGFWGFKVVHVDISNTY